MRTSPSVGTGLDFSSDWLAAISGSGLNASNPNSDLDSCILYLESLCAFFDNHDSESLDYPPSSPPPSLVDFASHNASHNASRNASHNASYNASNNASARNAMHAMNIDNMLFSTYNVSNNSNNNNIINNINNSINNSNVDSSSGTMTSRRILIRILTTQSEIYAAKALRLGKVRQWINGAHAYSMSYEYINRALNIADEQFVKCIQLEEAFAVDAAGVSVGAGLGSVLGAGAGAGAGVGVGMDQHKIQTQKQHLANDSNIIHVAISHFASDHEMYQNMTTKRISYLKQKLAPQWSTRDDMKQKMGPGRWNNNPNPKNDYALLRECDEKELDELVHTTVTLDDCSTELIESRVRDIIDSVSGNTHHRGHPHGNGNGDYGDYGDYDDDDDIDAIIRNNPQLAGQQNQKKQTRQIRRYNGIRPIYSNNPLHPRISIHDYPDPTTFGWVFTGSCESSLVEFYEILVPDANGSDNGYGNGRASANSRSSASASRSSLVKLDFYYTTGTVKTSLDHPQQGHTQLFGRGSESGSRNTRSGGDTNNEHGNANNVNTNENGSVSVTPEIYRSILMNPRVHTDIRYQTKKNNRRNKGQGNKGRGGSRNGDDNGNGRGYNRGGRRQGGRGRRGGRNGERQGDAHEGGQGDTQGGNQNNGDSYDFIN